jgi:hypothetical protein
MKKKSVVASGKHMRASVFLGHKHHTASGHTKKDLMVSRSTGKIVTKRSHAAGKKAYKNISKWAAAMKKARKLLKVKGFVPVGGKSAKGKALYKKIKELLK